MGSRGQTPLFIWLSFWLVKTCFNSIFLISSLSFFFLLCFVIFALNYELRFFSCVWISYFSSKFDESFFYAYVSCMILCGLHTPSMIVTITENINVFKLQKCLFILELPVLMILQIRPILTISLKMSYLKPHGKINLDLYEMWSVSLLYYVV